MDDPWYATDDVDDLNSCFDSVTTNNGIYHLMLHPNAIEWDKDYPWQHLAHISERKNIWYVATGHLYLYHLIQENAPEPLNIFAKQDMIPEDMILMQNYPNPFNPVTIINYKLEMTNIIELSLYDILGKKIATLVSGTQVAGHHSIEWDGSDFSSGIYFYVLRNSEAEVRTRKMMLLR